MLRTFQMTLVYTVLGVDNQVVQSGLSPMRGGGGGGGGGGGQGGTGGDRGFAIPLENHKNLGFLSNTDLAPLKITKLPSQHSRLGHHRHASETPC